MISSSVDIKSNSNSYLQELQRKAIAYVTSGGQIIQAEAKVRCPVDTGNLRSSIITEAFADDGVPSSETGPTAEYGPKVEYGSPRQRAQPFMEPGFQAAKQRLDQLARFLLGDR